jgi:asparagine synthase (glutamine-hydrolysing)
MCGIAGLIDIRQSLGPQRLEKLAGGMGERIAHRGPDDKGVWVAPDGRIALAHRRLSIIDTSAHGRQPMFNIDRTACISFNGEIYNYRELRSQLEARGARFATGTDTEVLIEAIRVYGTDVFRHLDGMYAFCFYDLKEKVIILGRDPFGEKPLYVARFSGLIAFASELSAIEAVPQFAREVDRDSLAQYFAFQYVPAPRTIYKNAQKLPPGHFLKIDAAGAETLGQHFSFNPLENPPSGQSMDQLADELEDILLRCIRRRLMSDVPLGAFLSGGVDSSTVVALVSSVIDHPIKTFCLGSSNSAESEHLYAREMAGKLKNVEHHELLISPDVPKYVQLVGEVVDEPLADSSCMPTYMLSEFARKQVTVLLSGDGGDEMFGGYGRYFGMMRELDAKLAGEANTADWSPSKGYFTWKILLFIENEIQDLFGGVPEETAAYFNSYKSALDSSKLPLISTLRQIDMYNYLPGAVLPKVDRMSMQHGLEVRTPFLSREVAAFAEKLAPASCYAEGQGKLVLKEVGARYLPRELLERKKMGFGVPTHLWGHESCCRKLRTLLLGKRSMLREFVDPAGLERFVIRQENPNTFSAYQVWTALIAEIWLRSHVGSQQGLEQGLWGVLQRGARMAQGVVGWR